jgi:secreted Zn-dependent insulinase-like peptidase
LWDIPNLKNICIRDKLLEFDSKWYSSHLMHLAELEKEDLNTLEELVVSQFENIEKKNINMPYWTNLIYKEEQLTTRTLVVLVKDIRVLRLRFPIPKNSKYYKSMLS